MVKNAYPKMIILRDSAHFDLIYWKAIGTLMTKKFTTSYATFYTKHIVGFCGVMHHRHNIDSSIPNICPCCGHPDETTDHILLCPDEGRTELYRKSVQQLVDWMKREQTHPMITRMVQTYLRARKTKTMKEVYKEIGDDEDEEWILAYMHDEIGWKCFTEGRISKRYVELQKKWFKSNAIQKSIQKWAMKFVENIIRITHHQWTFRNEKLHYRSHPGAESIFDYERSVNRICQQLDFIDPEELLPEDQYLLEVDAERMAEETADRRHVWQTCLDSALTTARIRKEKRTVREELEGDIEEYQSYHFRRQPNVGNTTAPRRWLYSKKRRTKKNTKKNTVEEMKRKRDSEVDPNSRFWQHGWKWNSAKKLRQWLKRGKSENRKG